MQSNYFFSNLKILNNKYFLVLCFYLKKNYTNNYILNSLFLGYKYNYLLLNINIFFKLFKKHLTLIQTIQQANGEILFLYTNNKILNYLIAKNCIKNNVAYLKNFKTKQVNLLHYLTTFPDLVISLDYKANAIILNKFQHYNVPTLCLTNLLNTNIVLNKMYYVIFNNKSIYSNIIVLHILFNTIKTNKLSF